MEEEQRLYHFEPDPEGTEYKYSQQLYEWFWNRVAATSTGPDYCGWEAPKVNHQYTMADNEKGGCRIFDVSGAYEKYYDLHFLVALFEAEWEAIQDGTMNDPPRLSDLVNWYNDALEEIPPQDA